MTKNLQFILAMTAVLLGIVLITVALFLPPPGEIHASVLVAYGETLTFAGAVIGVDYHYRWQDHPPKQP